MKTNYEHQRTTEGREAITRIARYASRGMMRTKQKSTHWVVIQYNLFLLRKGPYF